jgi:3-hydroxypropanoate dehydrogenase
MAACKVGYLILAARVLGLDCGPMSGLDNAKVNQEFFPGAKKPDKIQFPVQLGPTEIPRSFVRS